jgi:G:T/U-mismatch repair DNA glycosylase
MFKAFNPKVLLLGICPKEISRKMQIYIYGHFRVGVAIVRA